MLSNVVVLSVNQIKKKLEEDTTTKAKYTNPTIIKLCDFFINHDLGGLRIECELQGAQKTLNRGTLAGALTVALVSFSKGSKSELKNAVFSKMSENLQDRYAIEQGEKQASTLSITYANQNTNGAKVSNHIKKVLLLTPNGYYLVKSQDLVKDKTGHIKMCSYKNGRPVERYNNLVGFEC